MPECLTPVQILDANKKEQIVPCGKCENCRKKRASEWSFRLMQEEKISLDAHFITLTYDTKHVPITLHKFMSISKRDVQLFIKRLRKAQNNSKCRNSRDIRESLYAYAKIKYYAVGEYGDKTMRPHYHIIIFNARIELIQSAWNLGEVHYGKVENASVGYTLKYITKGKKVPMHQNDDRNTEFALMSKHLGENYLTKAMIRWHRSDLENRMHIVVNGDQKAAMPRYYKNKIYSNGERKTIGEINLIKMREHEYEMASKDRMYSRNRKEARQAITRKTKQLLKKLDKL